MGRYSGRGGNDHIAICRRSGLTPKGDLAIVIRSNDTRLGLMGMKKLLVLMLLAVMASLAGATIIMDAPAEVDPGETFFVTVSGLASDVIYLAQSGTQVNGAVETGIAADSFWLNDGTDGDGTVAAGSVTDNFASYSSYDYNIASPGGIVGTTADGLWVTINFIAGAGGEVYTFTRLDNSFAPTANQITTTVIPEPISMVLLGIGGLFLRRRK